MPRPSAGQIFGYAAKKLKAPRREKARYALLAKGAPVSKTEKKKFSGWDSSDFKCLVILIGDGTPETE